MTDHKPLVTILGPRSPVATLAAAQLQRWALLLSGYQYQVEFRPTAQHGNADCLSRLPICQHQPDALPEETPSLFNPLTRISQKTGSRFVKTHGLYKNRPS